MPATTNSFMHADQDKPRNKLGKNTKEGISMNETTRLMFDKSGKHYQKT